MSSDLVRFLFKPLSSNSSDPRQLFLRKKVRPLLEPSPALPKAHSSSNRQFLLRGIVSTLLVSSSAFSGGYRHRSLGHCHDSLKSELSSWFSPCSQLSPQALFSSVIYTRRKLSLRVSSFCNHRFVWPTSALVKPSSAHLRASAALHSFNLSYALRPVPLRSLPLSHGFGVSCPSTISKRAILSSLLWPTSALARSTKAQL